jgi:hypothetical protein
MLGVLNRIPGAKCEVGPCLVDAAFTEYVTVIPWDPVDAMKFCVLLTAQESHGRGHDRAKSDATTRSSGSLSDWAPIVRSGPSACFNE